MKNDSQKTPEDKRIDRFILAVCILILLSFGIIIYSNLHRNRPSELLVELTKLIKDDNLYEYKTFLQKHVERIEDPGLKLAIYNRLGWLHLSQQNYQQALKIYQKAYKIEPQIAQNAINLGLTLTHLGKFNEAIKYLNKAKNIDSKIPQIYNNLGVVFINKGEIFKAIDEFKKAIEVDSSFYRAYANLASIYVRLADFEKAESYIQKAIENKALESPEYKELFEEQLRHMKKLKDQN